MTTTIIIVIYVLSGAAAVSENDKICVIYIYLFFYSIIPIY